MKAAAAPGSLDGGLLDLLARGGGFRYVIVQSDDLPADVQAMRGRGVDVSDAVEGGRRTPDGRELRWRAARLTSAADPLPIFFLEHLTPLEERRPPESRAGHPNGVLGTDRVYIAVPDVKAAAQVYGRVLGLPVPPIQRGNVIKADMAVFNLGPTGLAVAQPAEPGPAAEALARSGPGPFQVLYRTSGMEAAATWMVAHGLPAPARGIRNTGEEAMLVGPETRAAPISASSGRGRRGVGRNVLRRPGASRRGRIAPSRRSSRARRRSACRTSASRSRARARA